MIKGMKVITRSGLLILFFLVYSSLYGQHDPCGVEDVYHEAYVKGVESIQLNRNNIQIPYKLHIVTDDDGSFLVNIDEVLNELELSSSYYSEVGIELLFCGMDYIKDSDLYYFDKTDDKPLADSYNDEKVLNLYIVEQAINSSGSSICGTASFPWAEYKYVVVKNSCSANGSTIAHEMGHYLGLLHTHHTGYGDELVDQTNCETAGDLICDTPADPRLNSDIVDQNCNYTGQEVDSNGDFYSPDPSLLMSYSRKYCRVLFSETQGAVMIGFYNDYYSDYACPVDLDGDGYSAPFDCDDANPDINPFATEIPDNGVDEDCDGEDLTTVAVDIVNSASISLYPNPVRDILRVSMPLSLDAELSLYGLDGSEKILAVKQKEIDLSALEPGIYILKIESRDLKLKTYKKVIRIP